MRREAKTTSRDRDGTEIAVVGMAGRFPGAADVEGFWTNLRRGVESVRRLSDEEMDSLGVPESVRRDPRWVPAAAEMPDLEAFDAEFFGVNPREAEILDPQQRVLLELAWQALEDAGCVPAEFPGPIGVFAGAATSTYLVFNLVNNPAVRRAVPPLQLLVGNSVDTLATRVSYKLDLKGPSHTVQCACSTSLLAVHCAAQSLLAEECDLALAGGISINVAQRGGYRFEDESILSPDGHCRPFDRRAAGTVFGSGGGVVALRRLADALADGDAVRAVLLASAVNNDGALKVGFTAPGVEGQAGVIAEALAAAGVEADSISYVEAHGTGTRLGDPVEIQALTRAFRPATERTGFCALGSVKGNVGHLDIAAGVTGLIKTVLALEHREIPPSLHFEEPNPEIDFAASPVFVSAGLLPWEAGGRPRRAGVSSFGFGGTNVHVVLEEAPPRPPAPAPARPRHLLMLSARTAAALEAASADLARHLEAHPGLDLADVAHTLAVGRRAFRRRRVLVARDAADAVAALRDPERRRLLDAAPGRRPHPPPAPAAGNGDLAAGLTALGRRWLAGERIDGRDLGAGRRVPLPTYPFERRRFWIDPGGAFDPVPADRSGRRAPGGAPALHARPEGGTAYAPPEGELERSLAGVWGRLLGIDRVGRHDSFFDLGGHSLLFTQLSSRLREAFGVDVPLDDLFAAPTVAGQAQVVETLRWVAAGAARGTGADDGREREEGEL